MTSVCLGSIKAIIRLRSASYGATGLHLRTAFGTYERVRLVNLLDQRRPSFPGLCRGRRWHKRPIPLGLRQLALGSLTPLLVRIPPVIPNQVFTHLGNMLSHLGQEIQWIENLEVALGTGQQILASGLGKSAQLVVAALVKHLARLSHINHACLTERTPQKVLDQALDGFPVACLQTHALVHAEAGVFPGTDVLDDLFGRLIQEF